LGAAVFASSEARPQVRRKARARHAAVDASVVPAMASVASELTAALGTDDAFELGLEALLDGIEARSLRRRRAR